MEEIEIGGLKKRFLFSDMLKEGDLYAVKVEGYLKMLSKDGKKDLIFIKVKANIEGFERDYLVSQWRVSSKAPVKLSSLKGDWLIKKDGENIFFSPSVTEEVCQ